MAIRFDSKTRTFTLHTNPRPLRVRMKGLVKDAVYLLEGREYTGTALMQGGLSFRSHGAIMIPGWYLWNGYKKESSLRKKAGRR